MTAIDPSPFVPRLRFPEFKDEWQPATIGDLFASANELERATTFESDKILTVKLHANGVVRNERTGALTGGTSYFKRWAGQFIFSKIDLLNGAFGIVPEELDGFYSSSDVPAFSFCPEHSPTFFLSWLTARYRRLEIERTGTSATLKRVSPEKFRALPILLASPAEQQKIADCLGSLEELIGAEVQMLAALRQHKQGLMQQLFPQPGDTVPRLRFPEFLDGSDWIADKFSDLYTFQRNNTLSRDKLNYKAGPAKNVHYGDIHTKFSTHFDITRETVPFVNQGEAVPETGSEDYCIEGDLIFADASEDTNDVGKCIEVVTLKGERLLSGQHTILARRSDDRLAVGFGGYLMRSKPIRAQIEKEAQGTKVYAISAARLGGIAMPFPPEHSEQERITDCLVSLDAMIGAQAERLDAIRQHKQGLLQQLFPAPEEEAR